MGQPHRWKKGESGNPLGRAKGAAGVAKMIREETNDYRDLVNFALNTFRNESLPLRDRQWAHDWLSDRGLGKPLQQVQVEQIVQTDDEAPLTDEELAMFEAMIKARENAVSASDSGDVQH